MSANTVEIVIVVLEVLLIPLISIGNVVIIATVLTHPKLRKPADILVSNLAIADLLVGVVVIPYDLYILISQKFFAIPVPCYMMSFLWTMALSNSVLSLFFIAVEKYLSIIRPLRHLALASSRKAICAGIISWTVAIILSSASLLIRNSWNNDVVCAYKPNSMTVVSFCFLASVVLTSVFLYCRVFVALSRPTIFPYSSAARRFRGSNIKKAKTMAFVFFAFVVFWSPLILYFFVLVVTRKNFFYLGSRILLLVGSMNSCSNWIVYVCKRQEFRKKVTSFCRSKRRFNFEAKSATIRTVTVL